MKLSPLAQRLYDDIAQFEIIDAHEHLPPEKDYLSHGYSGLNMFANYLRGDLLAAGLEPAFVDRMREDSTTPHAKWWPILKPYWEAVKNTSYARALRITAHALWGIDDINDRTIATLCEKVKADNTPGLYQRILQERCNIRKSITCVGRDDFSDDPGLVQITAFCHARGFHREDVAGFAEFIGRPVKTLDDAVEAEQAILKRDLDDFGAVGFKMTVGDFGVPDAKKAEAELKHALADGDPREPFPAVRDWLFDKALDVAAEADVPVAVHTGYWGDFRGLDPKLLFTFAPRRRDVRFDMFHLGSPMYRDAAIIGKTQPNVTVNLVWCAIISQLQTARMLDELIDLVPVNRIIAFGGDYRVAVQKVYGHLVMMREIVAAVLANRIEQGDFDRAYALHLAKLWFHDNPSRIYRI